MKISKYNKFVNESLFFKKGSFEQDIKEIDKLLIEIAKLEGIMTSRFDDDHKATGESISKFIAFNANVVEKLKNIFTKYTDNLTQEKCNSLILRFKNLKDFTAGLGFILKDYTDYRRWIINLNAIIYIIDHLKYSGIYNFNIDYDTRENNENNVNPLKLMKQKGEYVYVVHESYYKRKMKEQREAHKDADPYGEENWNEGVKWYNKGKLKKDPDFKEIEEEEDVYIDDQEFRDFLIKHNALYKFVTAYKTQHSKWPESFSQKYDRETYIDDAIIWRETEEGHGFWDNLNQEWIKYIGANEGVKWYNKGKLEPEIFEPKKTSDMDDLLNCFQETIIKVRKEDWPRFVNFCSLNDIKWWGSWGNAVRDDQFFGRNGKDVYIFLHPDKTIAHGDLDYVERLNKADEVVNFDLYEGVKWYSGGKLEKDVDWNKEVFEGDYMIDDDEFVLFLVDNGALDKFKANYIKQHPFLIGKSFRALYGRP